MMAMMCCLALIILTLSTALVDAHLLIVQRSDGSSDSDTNILRGYLAYASSSDDRFKVKCKVPEWVVNAESAYWNNSNNVELSPRQTGEYACIPPKMPANFTDITFENTVLKFFKATPDVRITGPQNLIVNYSGAPELIEITCKGIEAFDWFLDGTKLADGDRSNMKIHANGTLGITKPTYKDVGVYMCKLGNKLNFYSLKGAVYFPKKHGKNDDSENKLEDSSVSILHEVYGNPIPDFKWKMAKEEDDEKTSMDGAFLAAHENVRISPSVNVSNGLLEIVELKKDDRAHYYSYAKNNHGDESSFKTLIRVKGKLDALWPFLGIVVEVIILVAIILLYERRRLKQDQEPEEAQDQKKPLTTNSESVRQRKN